MPFEPGNQEAKKRSEAKGGRPSTKDVQQLRATLDAACPEETRQAVFKKMATEAKKGNVPAAKLLLSYLYGMPPSGDDLLIQEGVSQFVHDGYQQLINTYGQEKAGEIIRHFGVEPENVSAPVGGGGD